MYNTGNMKEYKITEELVNGIAQTLHNIDVGSKTLSAIVEALKKIPIVVEEKKAE